MELLQIKEILTLGKEFGLKQISLGEFHAVFGEGELPVQIPGDAIKIPTEEEFLYMSSGYDPKEEQRETPRITEEG